MANNVLDEKTKVPLYAVGFLGSVLIGFTVWITAVAADARKGAKAADKVIVIYYDVRAIKQHLNIPDRPIPQEDSGE